jgi:hypothetical protein
MWSLVWIYLSMQSTFSLEQGRRRGLFPPLMGPTTCTGLGDDVYSSIHDMEWGYMRWEGGEMGRSDNEEQGGHVLSLYMSYSDLGVCR